LKVAQVLIIVISAATGTCFAAIAGLSISAMAFPVRSFHVASIVLAAIGISIAWMSFRAAVRGFSEEETGEALVTPLHRGILGAFVGFLVIVALLIFFGAEGQRLLAHSLGRRSSGFTTLRMLTAAVLLGFGTGFVTGIRRAIQS
jgi:hypothetical protein